MIKKLSGCVREYKREAVLSPIFVTLEVIMEVIIPLVMAGLIDYGIDAGSMNEIVKYGAILVICALLSLMFGVLAAKYAATASAGFAKNLRKDMFYNVQTFSFSNIDKFSTASIITRLTTDVTNVQNAFMMIVRVAARAPLMLIFSIIMAFIINVEITLVFIGVLPFLAAALFLIINKAHPIFEKIFKTYDKLNNVVRENIRGVRVVKAYVREEHEISKFEKTSEVIFKDFSKAEKLIAFNGPVMQLAVYTCMIGASWIGAKLIVAGSLTTGELVSIITYAMQILMSLMMVSMIFVMITIARASAERTCEILEETSDIVDPEEPVTEVKDGSIIFKNVDFSYAGDADNLCLSGVDLEIKAGETVGIVGGTGSSKSTLVQLIPRLYDATEGEVLVGGVNVKDYDLNALRNSVSMVLQKNVLFSGTIIDNMHWGNEEAALEEIERACEISQAGEFIDTFPDKYDTYIDQGGTNVSGGQRQRLCIARALLKKPKILIMDDSTSAVDTATDAKIRRGFREDIPDTTKIVIAQRIASVEHADKIIVLDGGKINGIGTHDQLLKENEIYREAYTSQMKGGAGIGE
ncbi:MAG: ABC transporter ATP-binding protein [Clostridiales bacterium]|nr:ABC transporter ATP-binding protein [Clostridiales bacterium]